MASLSNTSAVQYPTPTGTWARPTHFGLWLHATSGTTANFAGGGALSSTVVQPTAGTDVDFPAGRLTVTVGEGDLSAAGALRALNGLLGTQVWVSLHSRDPGSSGAGELSGNAYARVRVARNGWS